MSAGLEARPGAGALLRAKHLGALDKTGESNKRTQKRYDHVALIIA
jgi:hypothetical protein